MRHADIFDTGVGQAHGLCAVCEIVINRLHDTFVLRRVFHRKNKKCGAQLTDVAGLCQLKEIFQIVKGCVPSCKIIINHKRRAGVRRHDRMVIMADLYRVLWINALENKGSGCGFDGILDKVCGDFDDVPFNGCAVLFKNFKNFRMVHLSAALPQYIQCSLVDCFYLFVG